MILNRQLLPTSKQSLTFEGIVNCNRLIIILINTLVGWFKYH